MIVEVEPQHQPVLGMETLANLRRDHRRIADQRVPMPETGTVVVAACVVALPWTADCAWVLGAGAGAGCAEAMREHVLAVRPKRTDLVDIVGTGGDGANSFNISTASMFVVAAAGARVAKHGNRAQSGRVGGADAFEALGVRVEAPDVAAVGAGRGQLGLLARGKGGERDTPRAPVYWFPRDCPRATFWAVEETTDDDVDRWVGGDRSRRVHDDGDDPAAVRQDGRLLRDPRRRRADGRSSRGRGHASGTARAPPAPARYRAGPGSGCGRRACPR